MLEPTPDAPAVVPQPPPEPPLASAGPADAATAAGDPGECGDAARPLEAAAMLVKADAPSSDAPQLTEAAVEREEPPVAQPTAKPPPPPPAVLAAAIDLLIPPGPAEEHRVLKALAHHLAAQPAFACDERKALIYLRQSVSATFKAKQLRVLMAARPGAFAYHRSHSIYHYRLKDVALLKAAAVAALPTAPLPGPAAPAPHRPRRRLRRPCRHLRPLPPA